MVFVETELNIQQPTSNSQRPTSKLGVFLLGRWTLAVGRWALILLIVLTMPPVFAQAPSDEVRVDPARTRGAVAGGLRWLAKHQVSSGAGAEEGGWQAKTSNYRPAIAALAGLAFLANGHLPGDDGPYGDTLAATLMYVMGAAAPDGYMGQGDRSGMYIHAISSLFAFSCLGMQAEEEREPELAEWCRRSLNVIVQAQQVLKTTTDRGGWRYDPYTSESDVSVTCWQMLVLHSARQAGFEVDDAVFRGAQAYLNRAFHVITPESGSEVSGGYLYRPGFTREPEPSATALVLYIQTLFDAADDTRTQQALTYLQGYPPTWDGDHYGGFFYFASFYMMQGMFQVGGEAWDWFGPRMALVLLDHQSGDGSWPYPPNNSKPALMRETGAAYPVAMAVLMLSLDKQFLPMFQRQRRLYDSITNIVIPDSTAAVEKTHGDGDDLRIPVPVPEIPLPAVPPPAFDTDPGAAWEDTDPGGETERRFGAPLFRN